MCQALPNTLRGLHHDSSQQLYEVGGYYYHFTSEETEA